MKISFWKTGLLMLSVVLAFASCEEEEIIRTSTHTDASALVGGTYSGSITNGTDLYTDAVVVLTQIPSDSTQAVVFTLQSTSFDNLDVTANINAGVANDGFVFSSGTGTTQKLSGRLIDNNLTLNIPLNSRGTVLSNASTGVVWIFSGTKN
ncbi:MAG TPA: hypothetical protein PLK12_16825 [Prolixibacteraceae bacterium]|nr:hypothetical protein [Prolixibacteraceae bacterium]